MVPAPSIARASHLLLKDRHRECLPLNPEWVSSLDPAQPWFVRRDRFLKRTDIQWELPSAQCYADISLQSAESYGRESCWRPPYPAVPPHLVAPGIRHLPDARRSLR